MLPGDVKDVGANWDPLCRRSKCIMRRGGDWSSSSDFRNRACFHDIYFDHLGDGQTPFGSVVAPAVAICTLYVLECTHASQKEKVVVEARHAMRAARGAAAAAQVQSRYC